MSEQAADLTVKKEEHNATHKPRKKSKIGFLLLLMVVLVSLAILAYGYVQLAQVNISLANTMTQAESQATRAMQQVQALQAAVQDLQQNALKSQTDQWYATEALYLLRLANDHLQYTHDNTLVISLLQRADQTLLASQDSRLLTVRKSLANDMATIQAAPALQVSDVYLQLSTLNDQIDQLTLPVNPLQNTDKPTVGKIDTSQMTWWQAGLARSLQLLRQIVIVRQYRPGSSPLVMPEEKGFLYQNLHAQLESAMWGVLHRDNTVYQASLTRSLHWVQQYFDLQTPAAKTVLQHLQEMQKINVTPTAVSLSATMDLLNNYLAPTSQSQPG